MVSNDIWDDEFQTSVKALCVFLATFLLHPCEHAKQLDFVKVSLLAYCGRHSVSKSWEQGRHRHQDLMDWIAQMMVLETFSPVSDLNDHENKVPVQRDNF